MTDAFSRGKWVKGAVHWREGRTAFISIAFTWQVPEARRLALYYRDVLRCRVRIGGPGTFTTKKHLQDVAEVGGSLPDVVARHNPSATYASRGCPVGCWFCIVPKMDGRDFTLIDDFPVRPVLCDNNLSALPVDFQEHIVQRYLKEGVPLLDANSGFEPKTFDAEVFFRWRRVLKGPWRLGYDEASEGAEVTRALRVLRNVPAYRKQVYVMIGHEPFDVCMARIRRVIELGAEPYAQRFIKLNALSKTPDVRHDWTIERLRDVARWVSRHLWRNVPFAEYDKTVSLPRTRA